MSAFLKTQDFKAETEILKTKLEFYQTLNYDFKNYIFK
jgi:hypothetical protein